MRDGKENYFVFEDHEVQRLQEEKQEEEERKEKEARWKREAAERAKIREELEEEQEKARVARLKRRVTPEAERLEKLRIQRMDDIIARNIMERQRKEEQQQQRQIKSIIPDSDELLSSGSSLPSVTELLTRPNQQDQVHVKDEQNQQANQQDQ
ncbi:hypothetical protein EG327_009415, partial [Venturia inaequalis]